jgi:hypothetical protein
MVERMVDGCRALVHHRVPPAGWALFGYHLWTEMGKYSKVPLKWLLSAQLVSNQVTWAKDFLAEKRLGGRMVVGPELAKLHRTYRMMTQELLLSRPTDEAGLRRVVDRHFPGRAFAQMVRAAQAESDAMLQRVSVRIANAEWVW